MRPFLRRPWPLHAQLLRWHPRAPQSIPRRIATTSAANAAPVDIPRLVLAPGSPHHNSLTSFLDHAERVHLAPTSPIYIGTRYEYTAALALLRLGFSLLRVGGQGDAGIDLIGHWVLAPLREPLRVIIQCKARNQSVSPCHLRELEGTLRGTPADWRNKDVLGLLVTTMRATKGTLKALAESRAPLGFVMVSKDGLVQQFVWNRAAAEQGLEGIGVTIRHTPRAHLTSDELLEEEADQPTKVSKKLAKFRNAGTTKDIQLTWMGSPIFPDRHDLDAETLQLMRIVFTGRNSSQPPEEKPARLQNGKLAIMAKAPAPRGGLVTGRRGRPRENPLAMPAAEPQPQPKESARPARPARPVGRPKGSKNKPKEVVDAG
ncbi:hypothetical protein BDU57DRAFT_521560 [Ampelomyces quisqualis]|uniref:Restriction endonuclease type IV Mrr domain-containing protein n=1 Tax=Ampelomyces quisqualis TaxID=50730 RepID=A0A6A5QC20_AMPQU|nr:hypothetical protein BDU57DRAFT_521560 [Ampelomyces quisqualis]